MHRNARSMADGLRAREGLRVWPAIGRSQSQLAEQLRQALGTDRFNRIFAAGARLSEQDYVAAARARSTSAATVRGRN
jgi:hypothetical protein